MIDEPKYTYYIFYINKKYRNEITTPPDEPNDGIYAYADDKEIANLFMSIRDMNKFIMKKKKLTTSEINRLSSDHMHGYLQNMTIKTQINGKISNYSIALTMLEMIVIGQEATSISANIFQYMTIPPFIFSDKYMKILTLFKYSNMYIHYLFGDKVNTPLSPFHQNIDELAIFIKLYGNMLA
jgi:hypothetical protein